MENLPQWRKFIAANQIMPKVVTDADEKKEVIEKKPLPAIEPGDTVDVHYKVVEGDKERIQIFNGVVINIRGNGTDRTFTVRKISAGGVGVERIFLFSSPYVADIEIKRRSKVRRAKLFYLRNLKGKAARLKEKKLI